MRWWPPDLFDQSLVWYVPPVKNFVSSVKKSTFENFRDFENFTIKDCPNEVATKQILDFGRPRKFESVFGGRPTGKFEVNNDKNNTVILYLDTHEKVTIKDHPEKLITNYASHIKFKNVNRDRKISFNWRDAVLANINNSEDVVAVYTDTQEEVTLEWARPNDIVTWIKRLYNWHKDESTVRVQINNDKRYLIDYPHLRPSLDQAFKKEEE